MTAPGSLRAEVERLEALGATVHDDQGDLIGMRDPEGNEFCGQT